MDRKVRYRAVYRDADTGRWREVWPHLGRPRGVKATARWLLLHLSGGRFA